MVDIFNVVFQYCDMFNIYFESKILVFFRIEFGYFQYVWVNYVGVENFDLVCFFVDGAVLFVVFKVGYIYFDRRFCEWEEVWMEFDFMVLVEYFFCD